MKLLIIIFYDFVTVQRAIRDTEAKFVYTQVSFMQQILIMSCS